MAENLIVGDPNCTFNMVTTAMNKSKDVEDIMNKWRKIAGALQVKKDVINKIERKILIENWTALDIMDESLHAWRSSASYNAKLSILLKILRDHDLNDIADEILKAFQLPVPSLMDTLQLSMQPQQGHYQPMLMPQHFQGPGYPLKAQYVPFEFYQHPLPQSSIAPTFPGTPLPSSIPAQGNIPYKPNASNQPIMGTGLMTSSEVDSGNDFQESNVDGGLSSKLKDTPTQSFVITKEDMNLRMLLDPQKAVVSVKAEKRAEREDDAYHLPGIEKGNGYALILNIIRYKKQGYRKGAQYDSFMLTQLFTQLGYNVIKYDDPNTFYTKSDVEEIVKLFRDYIKNKNPASVMVFIGCHGHLEEIQLSDETFTSLFESIVYQFDAKNCSKLNNVPKIFIIESCRDILHDGPGFKNIFNTIICYATLPGNKAARDPDSGTYYIKSLVKVFAENAHCKNLTELLDATKDDLWKELIKHGEKLDNRQQCMHVSLGDFKTFYFNF